MTIGTRWGKLSRAMDSGSLEGLARAWKAWHVRAWKAWKALGELGPDPAAAEAPTAPSASLPNDEETRRT